MKRFSLFNDDCLKIMPTIEEKSIDMILCDLPYGVTNNKWDIIIPFDQLWKEYERIIKDSGVVILTATQPFTSQLVVSNPKRFKYDLVWEKTISSNQLNVKTQPLRSHESILIFYKKIPIYNEQKTVGKPYSIKRDGDYGDGNYNKQLSSSKKNDGFRHARSVIKISNPRIKGGHPTQKPVELLEYLIKTYTNIGFTVLDNCMGTGSTGEACLNLDRNFIGIELDKKYFKIAKEKLENLQKPLSDYFLDE
jgi:site-specific DNA-methyltransferase (adenine-specific)